MSNIVELNSVEINSVVAGAGDAGTAVHVIFNVIMDSVGGEPCHCGDCSTFRNQVRNQAALMAAIASKYQVVFAVAAVVITAVIISSIVYGDNQKDDAVK